MQSVCDAGWDGALICIDGDAPIPMSGPRWPQYRHGGPRGSWPNWIAALTESVRRNPDADAYVILEDDGVMCRNVRGYLEWTLWPEAAEAVALCSFYRPQCYTDLMPLARGWHREYRGSCLVGTVAWAIPPESARAIIRDLGDLGGLSGIDAKVGGWALTTGRATWYHAPSLVQHIANDNSALGIHEPHVNMRTASDFPGVDFDARSLIQREHTP